MGRKRRQAAPDPSVSAVRAEKKHVREAFLERVRDLTPYLGVEAGGARFLVASGDRHMGKHLFLKQARPEFRVLQRAVAAVEALTGADTIAGRLFVDVGANIGTSTVSALVSQRFGAAVCCEPEAANHRLLRANLALNDLERRTTALQVAVSDRVDRSNLVVVGGPGGKSKVALEKRMIDEKKADFAARRRDDPTLELPDMNVTGVELVTLDRLAETGIVNADRVGMLWIDVEGHEGHVVSGARTLTDRGVPICLEFDPTGLEKHGGMQMIDEAAKKSYTHFVDVRRQETGLRRFALRPVAELPRLADRLLDPAIPASYTDLLLLRLDPKQASSATDLPALVRQRRAAPRG